MIKTKYMFSDAEAKAMEFSTTKNAVQNNVGK